MKTKKQLLFLLLLLSALGASAQSGLTGFNYQTIIRGPSGTPLASQSVNLRFSILSGSGAGLAEYVETKMIITNQFGLATHIIGRGLPQQGSFSGVKWANANQYVKVEADVNGGVNFSTIGTVELVAVPYALYTLNGQNGLNGAGGKNGQDGGIGTLAAPDGAAGGDLAGTYPNPTVAKLQTRALLSTAPTASQIIKWNGTAWAPAADGLSFPFIGTAPSVPTGTSAFSLTTTGLGNSFTLINNGLGIPLNVRIGAATNKNNAIEAITIGTGAAVAGLATGVGGTAGKFTAPDTVRSKALITEGAIQIKGLGAGPGKVLTSDTSGLATWQTPSGGGGGAGAAFEAVPLTDTAKTLTIPAKGEFVIKFEKENFDQGNMFDPATGIFKAASAGIYHFDVQLTLESVNYSGLNTLILKKNGQNFRASVDPQDNEGSISLHLSLNIQLAQNDTITLAILSNSFAPGKISWGGLYSYFSGFKVN